MSFWDIQTRFGQFSGQIWDQNNWKTWGSTSYGSKWWRPRAFDRNNLAAKVNAPMMMAHYGDMDVSKITEKPARRKNIMWLI